MGSGCTTALCGLKIFFKRRAGVLYRYRFTGESVETGEKDCEGDGAVSSLQAFPRAWGVGDSRPRLNRCQNALDFPTLETYADQAVPALGPPPARVPPSHHLYLAHSGAEVRGIPHLPKPGRCGAPVIRYGPGREKYRLVGTRRLATCPAQLSGDARPPWSTGKRLNPASSL